MGFRSLRTDRPLLGLAARKLLALVERLDHQYATPLAECVAEPRLGIDRFTTRMHVVGLELRLAMLGKAPGHLRQLGLSVLTQPHDFGDPHGRRHCHRRVVRHRSKTSHKEKRVLPGHELCELAAHD